MQTVSHPRGRGVGAWARMTAIAFAFMTCLPVPSVAPRAGELTRASALFPLVGLVVATVEVGVRAGVALLWGPATGAVAGVLAAVAVTGAFHEDGLADTADGLWGGWQREQRLAIMRDSRLGTYGTVALIGLFALRFALLVPASLGAFAAAVVSGHVLGRGAILLLTRVAPAIPGRSGVAVAGPLGVTGTAVALAVAVGAPVICAGWAAAPALVVAVAVTLAAARLFRTRVGGVTGDTIGATTVVVEVCVTATVLAWPALPWS